MAEPGLRNNPERQRYELVADGHVVGFVSYQPFGDALRLVHTEIAPGHEGKGYGSKLAKQMLDSVRSDGGRVVPACSFIASYIERHPEYQDMVANH
jgi:predicted GNAT family acetyltransferase